VPLVYFCEANYSIIDHRQSVPRAKARPINSEIRASDRQQLPKDKPPRGHFRSYAERSRGRAERAGMQRRSALHCIKVCGPAWLRLVARHVAGNRSNGT
jgi:hypothetical protein